jgi:hypothetical protein
MTAVHVLLAVVALGLLGVLVQAVRQNRALLREVRATGRPVRTLLLDALVLWSPLALVVVAAILSARWCTDAAIALAYRLTPVDEFCRVEGIAHELEIPCTGMDGRLPRDIVRRAGTMAEVGQLLSDRHRRLRVHLLHLTADQLRTEAADRAAFRASLAPGAVLGLPLAPEDAPELLRLRAELRRMLATPTPPARDPLDLLRYANERNQRVAQLRAVTAQARARRIALADAAYANLPRERQGQLFLAHRVSHLLAAIPSLPDARTQTALTRLVAREGDEAADLAQVRRGLASLLARNEAAAWTILEKEAVTPTGPGVLASALPLPRLCTVAHADYDLHRTADDMAEGDAAAFAAALPANSGTFACFDFPGGAASLELRSLGFRDSVRRSIDRWHAQALADGVRRLGALQSGAQSARDAAHEFAVAVPRGIDLGRSVCGLTHPVGCGENLVRKAFEDSLRDTFADVAEPLERGATNSAQAAADLDDRIADTLATLDERMARLRDAAHAQAANAFLAADLLRLLGWLTLALVVLKSYLYVLALDVFHHEGELSFGLEADGRVEGEVRAARQLTIDREFTRPLITRKQLSNTDNELRIAPWPWSAPLARILRGRYFVFTRGTFLADAERPARGRVASAPGGMAIVEWRMQPGEEVVFGYRDFFGASDNIRLRSEISLRLSTLLLGRLVFRTARCEDGEGRLLLRAHVEEHDLQHIRAIPPERLLAWHRHARFGIHSGRTLWKTLLNGYTLVRKPGVEGAEGQVVVSSEDVGSNFGSIRFVKRIFSAMF